MKRVAVVGAGWSGLAAAMELAHSGYAVTVFEASRYLGGRARKVTIDGIALDNGQHILLGAYGETLRLITLAGGDCKRLLLRLPLQLVYPGEFALVAPRWLPAPLHLAMALLCARGLGWLEKFAAVRFMTCLRKRRFAIDPDISVETLLLQYGQLPRARRFLWEPLCIAALNTQPRDASAAVFANVLRDAFTRARSDSDLLIPQVDLGALFPELAEAFVRSRGGGFRVGEPVSAISTQANCVKLATSTGTETFDAAVCAVPPNRTADMLVGETALCNGLQGFAYEPIVTCYLQYPAHIRLPAPMIGLDASYSQWAFDRGRLGGPAGLVAVVVSAAGRARALTPDQLAMAITRELAGILPGMPLPMHHRVITEKRATFRCSTGMWRPEVATSHGRVFLAGDHVSNEFPATLEGAVRNGINAAKAVLQATARATKAT
jgi:squalene-associated FAD-dependent desaturase